MIAALFMSAALMTAPQSYDREIAQLERVNALMQQCLSDGRAKSISRAKRSCRAALEYALTNDAVDGDGLRVLASMVRTLNVTDLRAQGWAD